MVWPTLPAVPRLAFWEIEAKLHEITEKMTPSMGAFSDLFYFDWFGSWDHGFKVHSNIGDYPPYSNHNNLPDALYSLKSFTCMFVAINHQTNEWAI